MAGLDDLLQQAMALDAKYSQSTGPLSPVGQAIASGSALPSYGTPRFTPAEPLQTYQKMTPLAGALMTPSTVAELPAEQRSALELESMMKYRTQNDLYKAGLEKAKQRSADAAFLLNLGDQAALGFGTELAAAAEAPFSPKTYGDLISEYGTAKQRLAETNPYASLAGGVTGAALPVLLSGGLSSAIAQGGRTVPTLAEMAVTGTTGAELRAAAGLEPLRKATQLKDLFKVATLQGALSGAGGAEPTQGMSTSEALLGRALGGGLGATAGIASVPVGLAVGKGLQVALSPKATMQAALKRMGASPLTDTETAAAVADIVENVGLTERGLQTAREAAAASSNPLMKEASTDQLVQNPGISTLRQISEAKSAAGMTGFWDQEKQQLAKINQNLQKTVDNIDMSNPRTAQQAAESAQTLIRDREKELHQVGNQMYADLPKDVEYTRSDLVNKMSDIYTSMFGPGKGSVDKKIQYAFDFLTKRLYPEGGPLSRRIFGKAEGAQTKINGLDLVDLRSGLLQAQRDLAETDPGQALLAGELGRVVHEFIQKDAKFGPKYTEANQFWSDLIDTFHSGPLANVHNKNIVSVDRFAEEVSRDVTRWQQFQKQTGFSPQVFKEQLATGFQKFAEAGADAATTMEAINAKLKVLDQLDTKQLYASPIDAKLQETYRLARQALEHTREFLKMAKSSKELVPPGMTADVLKTSSIDELAIMAATANEKAGGAPTQAFKAALRQFIRDKGRQGLSRIMSGGVGLGLGLGAIGAATSSSPEGKIASLGAGVVGAGALAGLGLKYNAITAANVAKLNEALTAALRNPEVMQKAFDARRVVSAAEQTAPRGITNMLGASLAGKAATKAMTTAGGAVASKVGGAVAKSMTKTPETPLDVEELARQLEAKYGTPASPQPTKTPKSLTEQISDLLVPPAEAATRKSKSTASPEQVTNYLSSRPPMIRSIAYVESRNDPKAKSGAGAVGIMQLMPIVAKEMKVNRHDPIENIKGGEAYYNKLANRFREQGPEFALAAYNWGQGNVSSVLKQLGERGLPATWQNLKPYLPKETRNYVARVMALNNYLLRKSGV